MQSHNITGGHTTDSIDGQLACRCLGVIVPIFNEVRTVEQILQRVLDQPSVREVIIVDDASNDGSLDLIGVLAQHDPRIRVISHDQNRGKGAAIRSGLTFATSDVIVIQDADLEYDPSDYAKMLDLILKGEADVVYGSRFAGQANKRASLWHTLGNRCLTWCSNFASGLSLTDEATCYKMFRRNILQNFELVEDRFGFCPEFTAKISKLDLNIREVPISYRPRGKAEGKKIRLKDGFNALSCIVRYNFSLRRMRNAIMPRLMASRWLIAIQALVYAFCLLVATENIPSPGNWYSASTPFREQTEAFLRGELALSHNLGDLQYDFCWANGGTHQVWGLGVPLWRLPFELLARMCGQKAFPDRIALGLFIALAAFVVLSTWLNPVLKFHSTTILNDPAAYLRLAFLGIGAVELILSFAPIINALSSRMLVFEEVMIYVYCYGIILSCGIVALTRKPEWPRFWLLSGLAGFGGFIRPTLLFYGIATLLVGSVIMWLARRGNRLSMVRCLLIAGCLFCFGGGCLFLTNLSRFGNGFEFGHRLNVQAGNLIPSVYSTRFDYPFAHEPLYKAFRELFGALFQVKELNRFNWYQKAFFVGQSETLRWREFNCTTYDISYACGICVLVLVGTWKVWQRFQLLKACRKELALSNLAMSPASLLILWGGISCLITAAFYLKTPAIASRYMLDFAAGFVAMLIGLWWWIVNALTTERNFSIVQLSVAFLALLTWQGAEVVSMRSSLGRPASVTYEELVSIRSNRDTQLPAFPLTECWTAATAKASGIPFNGEGWDSETDNTKAAIELFIKDPKSLYLDLTPRMGARLTLSDYDCIQTKVGLEFLQRKGITSLTNGVRVEFNLPKKQQYQKGIQPIFLGMVKPFDLSTNESQFRLLKVGWNEN